MTGHPKDLAAAAARARAMAAIVGREAGARFAAQERELAEPGASDIVAVEPHLVITSLANVEQQDTDWLWLRWLPRGKFLLLGGHAGDGKSTLMAALAAAGSRGGTWPDGSPVRSPLRFLFLLGEDSAADTLKPRLAVHGAAMDRIFTIETILDERGKERTFDVRKHLDLLEQAALAYGIDVIIIDPLTTVMPGADRNGEGDTRDLLTPLVKMAERLGVAIVGIVHVGKSEGSRRAAQKILGATAFVALARIVWMIAPAPDGSRVLGVVKSNLAIKPEAISWDREEDGPIIWHGVASQGVEELLAVAPLATPRANAEGFLQEQLAAGMKPVREIEEAAKQHGISAATLRRARETLGVKSDKLNFNGVWYWSLPVGETAPTPKMLTPIGSQVSIFAESKMLTAAQGEHLAEITPLFGHGDTSEDAGTAEDAHLPVYRGEHLREGSEPDLHAAQPEPASADIARMVAELRRFTPDELTWYRAEIASAPEDDPHLPIDRAALALFDAESAPASGKAGAR